MTDEVLLRELLIPAGEPEPVQPLREYRMLGVRLEGRGAFHRETRLGGELSAKSLNRVAAGEFVYSRLFAWRGAFSMIPPELDRAYVSTEFPVFRVDTNQVEPQYLLMVLTSPQVLRRVESLCTGSTPLTRNRLKPADLLSMSIGLPSMAEQRRRVSRIQGLLSTTSRIAALGKQQTRQLDDLLGSTVEAGIHAFAQAVVPLGELLSDKRAGSWGVDPVGNGDVPVVRSTEFLRGDVIPETAQLRSLTGPWEPLREGDLLAIKSSGSEGLVGEVAYFREPRTSAKYYFSNFIHLLRPDPLLVLPRYLWFVLRAPRQRAAVRDMNQTTSGLRNLNVRRFLSLPIPTPTVDQQASLLAIWEPLLARSREVSRLRHLGMADADTLLRLVLGAALHQPWEEGGGDRVTDASPVSQLSLPL